MSQGYGPNAYFQSVPGPPRKPRGFLRRLRDALRAAWIVFRVEWHGGFWEA